MNLEKWKERNGNLCQLQLYPYDIRMFLNYFPEYFKFDYNNIPY